MFVNVSWVALREVDSELYAGIFTEYLHGNCNQDDAKKFTDNGDAGWPQYFFYNAQRTQTDQYDDQVNKNADQDIVIMIACFQRHNCGERTGTRNDGKGDRNDAS